MQKNHTEKRSGENAFYPQKSQKTLDTFVLSSSQRQSKNYTLVIQNFLVIQKLHEKTAVARTHPGLKKYSKNN